jgi:hypothetical protein
MDEVDMRAAFLAGFALGRTGRTDGDLAPISVRTACFRFERWYELYPDEG